MTADGLANYVNAAPTDAYVASCWTTAEALVSEFVGGHAVPDAILKRATLEVGAELVHRKQAPSGFAQFATPDGNGSQRVARDPLVAARPLLAAYVGRGIAFGGSSLPAPADLDGGTP